MSGLYKIRSYKDVGKGLCSKCYCKSLKQIQLKTVAPILVQKKLFKKTCGEYLFL